MTGILSCQDIVFRHLRQKDRPSMDSSFGSRTIKTLKKLPITKPKTKNNKAMSLAYSTKRMALSAIRFGVCHKLYFTPTSNTQLLLERSLSAQLLEAGSGPLVKTPIRPVDLAVQPVVVISSSVFTAGLPTSSSAQT